MKTWIRRIAIAPFLLSFAPIVPKVGKVLAQVPAGQDFIFTNSTKGNINYETAPPQCMYGPGSPRVISCQDSYLDSDSYSINAGIDVGNASELDRDLTTNGLLVFLDPEPDCNGYEKFLSAQAIPGNQIKKTVTKNSKWTIYSWEGNVPNFVYDTYDHMKMNLKVDNSNPAKSALHIEASADLCNWTNNPQYGTPLSSGQPVSMGFYIGGLEGAPSFIPGAIPDDGDGDFDCTTFTPSFSAENISPAVCFGDF